MDFTPHLERLRQNAELAETLLGSSRMVLCLGSRALLYVAIAAIRQPGQILAAVTTEAEGLAQVEARAPELLVVSDRLEHGCGIALAVAVRHRFPDCRILLLVEREHRLWKIQEAIDAGCEGILLDSEIGEGQELTALRSVCSGRVYRRGDLGRRGPSRLTLPLSNREREVLRLLVQGGGRSNHAIAQELTLSQETVRTHVRNLLAKLQARDRLHAALRAVHLGLVDYHEAASDR
ncbi:MAG: response regulator transcription factor [Synechococcaceae cyanobacterium]|nr:response regulator transcription factor [Synechococcaceae cyanobacterium]